MMNSLDNPAHNMVFVHPHFGYTVDIIFINSYKSIFHFELHTRSDFLITKVLECLLAKKPHRRLVDKWDLFSTHFNLWIIWCAGCWSPSNFFLTISNFFMARLLHLAGLAFIVLVHFRKVSTGLRSSLQPPTLLQSLSGRLYSLSETVLNLCSSTGTHHLVWSLEDLTAALILSGSAQPSGHPGISQFGT